MPGIKAIVFDMDGVLIDAKEWHYDALNQALGLFGHEIGRQDHLRIYDGLPTRRKLEMLSECQGFPIGLHRLVNRMKQLYTLRIAEQLCRPNPVHVRTLWKLKQDGFLLGLASNSIRRTVDALMQKSHLDSLLAFTISNEDVTRPKPSPEIYEMAMDLAGTLPHETLVVEDNAHGVTAAQRAGAHVLRVQSVNEVNYPNIVARIHRIGSLRQDRAA